MNNKSTVSLFALIVVLLFILIGCKGVPISKPSKVSSNKMVYQIDDNQTNVTFIYNEKIQGKTAFKSVSLGGTFNRWKDSPDWQLSSTSKGIWTLTVPAIKARVPGNSGYAEFKFIIDGDNWLSPLATTPAGYTFKGNYVLLFPGDDPEQNIENEKIAMRVKTLEDFDITIEADRRTIANFRQVPGTTKLFRSYHPCDQSKPSDTQVERRVRVNEFLESSGIKSLISLSDVYKTSVKSSVSENVKSIIDDGHFLAINPSYESVYYGSDSAEFGNQFKEVVEFIINPANETPFLIHCKIGTDRTGVFSALIASLCGTSWEEIIIDYQKSNEVGFEEYRDVKLLQYSFENILKTSITPDLDLQTAVSDYFINGGYLTSQQVTALNAKLNN